MAKKQDAPCLFCGGLPCECGGGPTKKRSKTSRTKASSPAPKPTSESSPTSSSVESDKDTEDIFGAIPTPEKSKFNVTPTSVAEKDLELLYVLRVLRPIVSLRDQRDIDQIFKAPYPQDLDRRVARWKARHGSGNSSVTVRFWNERPPPSD